MDAKELELLAQPLRRALKGDAAALAGLERVIALGQGASHPLGSAAHFQEEQELNQLAIELASHINHEESQAAAIALFDAVRRSLQH